jgi:hypothetical protein
LLAAWPLVAHFTSHVPGDGIDDPSLAWNLWWVKERLVDQPLLDIFHVGWMFHPVDINLGFYTLTPLNGLLSIPLQTTLGLIAANNLVLLSSFILSGYGAFLLTSLVLAHLQRCEGSPSPGVHSAVPFFAGLVYAFTAPKLFYASLGQFNIASSQWIPFCILFLLSMRQCPPGDSVRRSAFFAGLFLVFQAWAELTYASFLLIFIGLHLVWGLFSWFSTGRGGWPWFRSQLAGYLIIAVVFLLGVSPFLWVMLPDLRAEGDFFASGGGFADVFSADLAGFLLPTRLHPLFGAWTALLPFPNDKGQHVFVGLTVVILAVIGALRLVRSHASAVRSCSWFWIASTLVFWLLTLGPRLRWMGQDLPIPGPFALVSLLPFFSGNRYPSRYSVMLLVMLSVLAAVGLWVIVEKAATRRTSPQAQPERQLSRLSFLAVVIVGALFAIEHLSAPLPLNDFRIPPIYKTLAALEGDFAVLELPTGWRNGARVLGKSDVLIMMQQQRQTLHEKRRLGGNTSRNPQYKFQYFTEAPLIGDMISLMNADRDYLTPVIDENLDAMVARNRRIAPQVLQQLGIEAVTVHVEKSPPQLLRFIEEALPLTLVEEWKGSDWSGAPAVIRLYRVTPPADHQPYSVELASDAGRLHLAEGWSALANEETGARYALRPSLDLLLNAPAEGGALALEVGGPARAVTLSLNGAPVAAASLDGAEAVTVITATIPPGLAAAPVDRLTLDFSGESLPVSALATGDAPGGGMVGEAGATLPSTATIVVRSAGEDVGDFAQMFVNGKDLAANERGYNLVALDSGGNVLESTYFDTFASDEESFALADWLRRWPSGTVIAGAVADEASLHLNQDAVDALAGVGVATDLRNKFRWSHAFIGAVGALPGSALEDAGLIRPASVWLGAPVDGERVFGSVGKLEISGR